uniref:Ig-like domain-containing protein n=1 Tax=Salmo trutta TaxID=8032 RepID=A0A673W9N9_SALTR
LMRGGSTELACMLWSSEVQVVGPADPVVALAGDDIILPCSLKPSASAEDMAVRWKRLNPTTENVHLYRDRRNSNEDQHPSYRGRTSLFNEELKNGNVSLKLTRVTLSDAGSYRCFIPTLTSQEKETTVQLFVGEGFVLVVIFYVRFLCVAECGFQFYIYI